jgi:hypothetical protein
MPLAQAKKHPWFIGELAYWGWRAGAIARRPTACAEPYALEIGGRWREAAEAWLRLDCPYERARALAAAGDAEAQKQALAIFDALGAATRRRDAAPPVCASGVRGVARGARASTRSHPCGLTATEMKVLALMGEDLRNAEIAAACTARCAPSTTTWRRCWPSSACGRGWRRCAAPSARAGWRNLGNRARAN